MSVITTVRGEIAPEALGFTSMHDHLNADMHLLTINAKQFAPATPPDFMLTLENHNLAFLRRGASIFSRDAMTDGDVDYTAAELGYFQRIGGGAVVDPSPIGIRGDVNALRSASERADVHVIAATGLYTANARHEAYVGWIEQQQIELFTRELTEGIDDTGVRAGIIKCALSVATPDSPLQEIELTTLRASAKAAAETGVSVNVHTSFPMTGDHIAQVLSILLDEQGLAADRVVMMHMDSHLRGWNSRMEYLSSIESVKTIDTSTIERVLDRGVTIGFDNWGSAVDILPQDDDRLKGLIHLVRKGYDGQIVLGHDLLDKSQGVSYGGTGLTWFHTVISGAFAQLGIADESYRRMTVDTPARVLAH